MEEVIVIGPNEGDPIGWNGKMVEWRNEGTAVT